MLRLFCDRRIKPDRYYVAEKEESMFVPKELQACVCFIYCNQGGEKTPAGTAFFIAIPDEQQKGQKMGWTYAVTSRHVIEDIKKEGDDFKVYFRLNRRRGKTEFVETQAKDWIYHQDDPMVDVAIFPWQPPFTDFETDIIWNATFATEEVIEKYCVGTGDEVFVVGLFSMRLGRGKNIPIVRIGNIAAMPSEPINTVVGKSSGLMQAYLIEARSTSGLSGSPVFVNLGTSRKIGKRTLHATATKNDPRGVFYLIGIMHGHYDDLETKTPLTDKRINMGIGIVAPIEQLNEILNQPVARKIRNEMKEQYMKETRPTLDSNLLARSVIEAAIGEPLISPKKKKKPVKKGSKRAS